MSANQLAKLLVLMTALAGCDSVSSFMDPMRNVETLSEVELSEDAQAAQLLTSDETISEVLKDVLDDGEEVQAAPRRGLFGLFGTGGNAPESTEPVTETEMASAQPQEPSVAGQGRGLFGLFTASSRASEPEAPSIETNDAPNSLLAMFTGQQEPEAAVEPEIPEVELEFGMLQPACGLRQRDLGGEVASASGFKIFDSEPGSTTLRPHYVTGFDDRCPRKFLAALVFLGDVGTHEVVRYSRTRVTLDYSLTDKAYEQIKGSFCRVSEGEPCGDRLERLGRMTTFVTAYRTFGAGPVWAEFLLHDGAVAAVDLEGL